jgi:hypothetical protein
VLNPGPGVGWLPVRSYFVPLGRGPSRGDWGRYCLARADSVGIDRGPTRAGQGVTPSQRTVRGLADASTSVGPCRCLVLACVRLAARKPRRCRMPGFSMRSLVVVGAGSVDICGVCLAPGPSCASKPVAARAECVRVRWRSHGITPIGWQSGCQGADQLKGMPRNGPA